MALQFDKYDIAKQLADIRRSCKQFKPISQSIKIVDKRKKKKNEKTIPYYPDVSD